MTPPEGILMHGHMVAELDDITADAALPPATVSPPRAATRARSGTLDRIRTALRLPARAALAVGAPLLLFALACADSPAPVPLPDAVASVVVAPEQRALVVGETALLTATARSASGRPLEGRAVAWTSSDTAVAMVSSTGRVAAGRPGAAVVSATSEGRVGRAVVTVRPGPLARLELHPSPVVLARGEARQVTALGRDAAGNVLPLGAVAWTSSDPAVAAVTSGGPTTVVTAGGPGTALITATADGRSARAEVTVTAPPRPPVDRVEVTPTAVVLERGATRQLAAVARDAAGNALADRAVAWRSDNPFAATVSATGLVTAVSPGYATIVATAEGKSFGVAVTVPSPPVTEYELLLVNGSPMPRTLHTTTETGPDGVTRTTRWDAYEGDLRLGDGRFEMRVGTWTFRDGSPAVQGAYVYRGTFLYDVLDGGIVFHPADGGPQFRGFAVERTLVLARRLVPGGPEVTFLYRLR